MNDLYPPGIKASDKTSSGTVLTGKGKFWGFLMEATAGNAEVTVYDNTAGSGTVIARGGAATGKDGFNGLLPRPIDVATGIHIVLANASATVYYQASADYTG